jgi:hypothetical protein
MFARHDAHSLDLPQASRFPAARRTLGIITVRKEIRQRPEDGFSAISSRMFSFGDSEIAQTKRPSNFEPNGFIRRLQCVLR